MQMVSTPPTFSLGPGSGSSSRLEMRMATDTIRTTDTKELDAVPGPKSANQEVWIMNTFGLDGFSDKYTERTKGTLISS